jgi:hypothetical protein
MVNQELVLRKTVAQIANSVNKIAPTIRPMPLISIGSDKLSNIHFMEYPGKEINIPKWNSLFEEIILCVGYSGRDSGL